MLVVRPQPGQALTIGVNARRPIVCRISCATCTSRVRSPPGSGRERDADRVADALLQQHRHRRRRGDDAFRAHARLGEAEVQRVVAARARGCGRPRSGPAPAHLAGETMRSPRQARAPRAWRADSSAETITRLAHHLVGVQRMRAAARSRPSAAPAAPGRGCPSSRRCAPACRSARAHLDHGGELLVALACPCRRCPG